MRRHHPVLLFVAIMHVLVVVMVCGNKPTIRRNSVQVPLRGGGPVKIMMYMQRGNVNSKNKKKKGVAKHFTPRPKRTTAEQRQLVKRECELPLKVDLRMMGNKIIFNVVKQRIVIGGLPKGSMMMPGYKSGVHWFKSEFSDSHSFEKAHEFCASIAGTLPSPNNNADFRKMYDFMNGSTSDNFYDQTYQTDGGQENWCSNNKTVPPEISMDGLKLLRESTILVTRKNSATKYKLVAISKSQRTQLNVNHFFCQQK